MLNMDEMSLTVIENLGGPENIANLSDDRGRIKFSLKSVGDVKEDSLRKLGGITGILEADSDVYLMVEDQIHEKLYKGISVRMPSVGNTEKKSLFGKIRNIFRKGQPVL